jgi:acyl-CoA thioester hydrolase
MPEALISHVFPVRVYYEDTDTAGIVYYANYLKFAERARTEMLRARGIENRALSEQEGVAFAVRRLTADYLAPARLDDLLEVHTQITSFGGASLEGHQDIMHNGRPIVRLTLTLACVAKSGRPARLPATVIAALGGETKPKKKRESHG